MLKVGEEDCKFRSYFEQILHSFLKGVCVSESMRPLPPVLGDGRVVDLYKLFLIVRENGGYDMVSKKAGLWCKVAEEIGLDRGIGSSVKLSYFKYLYPFHRWLNNILRDKGRRGGGGEYGGNLALLPIELETELKSLLGLIEKQFKSEKNEESGQLDSKKNDMNGDSSVTELGGGNKCVDDDDNEKGDIMILDPSVVDGSIFSPRKRKREDSGSEIAKDRSDTTTGRSMEASEKQEADERNDFFVSAMLARNAFLRKEHVHSSGENFPFETKQKIHPCMHEDAVSVNHLSTERSRCNWRLSEKDSCLHHESFNKDTSVIHSHSGEKNISDSVTVADKVYNPFDDGLYREQVRVGLRFQAAVPEWTGIVSESDSKWLGTQNWPIKAKKQSTLVERDPIGKGQRDSCDCEKPGSIECVRFHIAENRMRLKLELGSEVFYRWRFHHLGEVVSLQWTKEEEMRFKDIVRLNRPSMDKCFWNQVYRSFRTKSRETLVSYYFNVFVLRRRSYQNRVTPYNIDSDDDESEFGSVSNDFGHEAVKVQNSKLVVCGQNYQCTDLD